MIRLVLDAARQQSIGLKFERLSIETDGPYDDAAVALYIETDSRQTEAPFVPGFQRSSRFRTEFDLGIDEDPLLSWWLFSGCDIENEDSCIPANLGRGQSDPLVFVHQFEHSLDTGTNTVIGRSQWSATAIEERVRIKPQTQLLRPRNIGRGREIRGVGRR